MTVASVPPVVVALAWLVLVPPVALALTVIAGRLLGIRRGWFSLMFAGVIGWTTAIVLGGVLTDWNWSSAEMVATVLVFGGLFTMAAAVALDLAAPPGSLKRGSEAGLFVIPHPIRDLRVGMRPLTRYREIVRIARANGLLHHARSRDPRAQLVGSEVAIRQTLEQAGGIFVKLGQVASTRTDLLPTSLCAELGKLRGEAAPASRTDMEPTLEIELGRSPETVFAEFDWEPLASASIAQVYRARLDTGEQVVVKVQRPNLDALVEQDAAAMRQLAGAIERHTPLGRTLHPLDLVNEFLDNLAEELDFTIEASNALALAAVTPPELGLRIPAVYLELSTSRVLVEEYFAGLPITAAAAEMSPEHRTELGDRILRAFMHHVLTEGVFHADPHPGNIIVLDDGAVGLIDLGAVGILGLVEREAVAHMFIGVASGDAATLREALLTVAIVEGDANPKAIDAALGRFLSRNVRAGGGMSAETFSELISLSGEIGLRPPPWFATLGRTFVTLEGTLRLVDPRFSLVDAAMRAAPSVSTPSLHPTELRTAVTEELAVQLPRLRRLPERIDTILDQAASGRFGARLSLFDDDRNERVLTRLVNRVVLGILAASIGIGSTVMLSVDSGPELTRTVSLPELLGYFGLAAASILALRVVAAIVRDGTL